MSLALFVVWAAGFLGTIYALYRWPVASVGIPAVLIAWTVVPWAFWAGVVVVVATAVWYRARGMIRPRRSLLPAIPRRVTQPVQAAPQPPARVDTRPCACGGVITATQAGRLASIACDSCDSPAFLLPNAG